MPVPDTFRTQSELLDYLTLLEDRVSRLEAENVELRTTFDTEKKELETELEIGAREQAIARAVDEALPRTGLISQSFMTRAFSVWGHYFVAQILIGLVGLVIYILVIMALIPYLMRLR